MLFQLGEFNLHSGAKSSYKIDCNSLNHDDIVAICDWIKKIVPSYRMVVGIPNGGIPFEIQLKSFTDPSSDTILIVDDVLTTGKSMEKKRYDLHGEFPSMKKVGVVAFARGFCPAWIECVWELNPIIWDE